MITTPPSRIKLVIACFIILDIILVISALVWYKTQTSVIPEHSHSASGSTAKVHYHANFLVFLDKDFVNFDGDQYMEELASCAVDPNKETPQDRVHLHENKGGLLHVHDAGAAWGHLMSNLRWNFGADYIVDNAGKMYRSDAQKKLRFVLNGKFIQNPQNLQIRSEDRLLIDYSNATNDAVIARAAMVPSSAHEQNSLPDPAACGGHDE